MIFSAQFQIISKIRTFILNLSRNLSQDRHQSKPYLHIQYLFSNGILSSIYHFQYILAEKCLLNRRLPYWALSIDLLDLDVREFSFSMLPLAVCLVPFLRRIWNLIPIHIGTSPIRLVLKMTRSTCTVFIWDYPMTACPKIPCVSRLV